jgi:GT2 family glycosyltransferase
MDLSVITVTWNSEKNIAAQISSVISGCSDISFEQIVIDNHSLDTTADLVRKNFPGVKLIVNSENKGFAAANNQGLAVARGQFILFLNPDMLVTPGSLDKIVEWLKNYFLIGSFRYTWDKE